MSDRGADPVAPTETGSSHDLNYRRIYRALAGRKRYRYVTPNVVRIAGGYRIESPCCSRNIDADGGMIDVALILFAETEQVWQLHRKDHGSGRWVLDGLHAALSTLLERLNSDPDRIFWQ